MGKFREWYEQQELNEGILDHVQLWLMRGVNKAVQWVLKPAMAVAGGSAIGGFATFGGYESQGIVTAIVSGISGVMIGMMSGARLGDFISDWAETIARRTLAKIKGEKDPNVIRQVAAKEAQLFFKNWSRPEQKQP